MTRGQLVVLGLGVQGKPKGHSSEQEDHDFYDGILKFKKSHLKLQVTHHKWKIMEIVLSGNMRWK